MNPAVTLGGRTRARSARPSFRIVSRGGASIGVLKLHNGAQFLVSPDRWDKHLCYKFPNRVSLDSNGTRHSYPRSMSLDPHGKQRSRSTTLARLFVAEALVETERKGGPKAPAKGWVVEYVNGDRSDLRDENLRARPAQGNRNGIQAVISARERANLVTAGKDPNKVFAERRRQRRAEANGSPECSALETQVNTRAAEEAFPPVSTNVAQERTSEGVRQ